MSRYLVRCKFAKYDESEEMLVLLCSFEEFKEPRFVHFARSDFCYKSPDMPVPHNEMHRTADLFRNKKFYLIIDDDPARSKVADVVSPEVIGEFRKEMSGELDKISDGLADPDKILVRQIGDVIEKDRTLESMLSDEMAIRARLKDVKFEDHDAKS